VDLLPSVFQWSATAKVLLSYAELRESKGVLGSDFLLRTLRGAARRWSGPRGNPRSPLITSIAINSACPLRCFHCSADGVGHGQLPKDVLLRTIDGIVATGCPVIVITGGEPLLCKHVLDVVERIPPEVTVSLYTSGFGLTDAHVEFFRNRPNLLVCFSLDHGEQGEHDRRRGFPGAYEGVMNGLRRLKGGRCELHISSLVTSDRLDSGELERFVRQLAGLVSCVQWFQPRPVGRLSGNSAALLSPQDELRAWALANALNEDASLPMVVAHPAVQHADMLGCCAGYARMYIDSKGHVNPCDFAPLSFGKVTEDSVPVLWERMRSFFTAPGTQCLSRDMPDLWEGREDGRHVVFETLQDKKRLRTAAPAMYETYGEAFYRLLLGSLALAAVAAREWPHGAGAAA
jgi:MoaA/NifB/PqqE/SkfB family radical SAM enzyme